MHLCFTTKSLHFTLTKNQKRLKRKCKQKNVNGNKRLWKMVRLLLSDKVAATELVENNESISKRTQSFL